MRVYRGDFFILDEDGMAYSVGTWKNGEFVPGSEEDARRELALMEEPGAIIVRRVET